MSAENRSHWNFESTQSGWRWDVAHADGTIESCADTFRTLKECVDDAKQRGYLMWKPERERRYAS